MGKKTKINGNEKISDLLEYPEITEILFESGLSCIGCPMAMQETLKQACSAHGLDTKKIIKKINTKLKKKK